MALPDVIEIVPLDKPVRAEITVPGSKSITNRALILAALADGEVTLEGALWSEDTQIMTECLQELGFMVNVQPDPAEPDNRTITVYGRGGEVPGGGTEQQPLELFVGNAGTAARFLAAFVCLGRGAYRLHGVERMHERPQAALFRALRELGYRVEAENNNDKLPARIFGGEISPGRSLDPLAPKYQESLSGISLGRHARACRISIAESSQFASALMLCARRGGWEVKVVGENAEESPYVAMTTKLIDDFPHRGGSFLIEADASSGSYFLAAEHIVPSVEHEESFREFDTKVPVTIHNRIKVSGWPRSGWQVDQNFQEFLILKEDFQDNLADARLGGTPGWQDLSRAMPKRSKARVSRSTDLGDSIMLAIVISPLLKTRSGIPIQFTDLGRLRVQECERVVALRTELTKCGANVVEEGDTLTVYPSVLHGAEIETYNDHRMAMCFAILGLKVPGIKIKNPACVKKTFPNFFQKLAAPPPHGLGATLRDAATGRPLELGELFAE